MFELLSLEIDTEDEDSDDALPDEDGSLVGACWVQPASSVTETIAVTITPMVFARFRINCNLLKRDCIDDQYRQILQLFTHGLILETEEWFLSIGVEMQEFIVNRGDDRIYGKIAFPEGEGPWPIVIFSHGFGSSHAYNSGMDQTFTERGFAFAAFDFCGGGPHSQSSSTMLEMSVLTEAADLEAVVDWACGQENVDSRNVMLLGSSQGGYVSTYVASERPDDVAGLALFFPAFCIGDNAYERIAECGGDIPEQMHVWQYVVGRRYNEDAMAVDIYERIRSYEGDVLIVHGDQDDIVPIEYSIRAAKEFGGNCKLEVLEGFGHGFRMYPIEYLERAHGLALEFFENHVR